MTDLKAHELHEYEGEPAPTPTIPTLSDLKARTLTFSNFVAYSSHLRAYIVALEARVKTLETALKPFADASFDVDVIEMEGYVELLLPQENDEPCTMATGDGDWLTVVHLRNAQRVLEGKG